jgi:hypothetical protein
VTLTDKKITERFWQRGEIRFVVELESPDVGQNCTELGRELVTEGGFETLTQDTSEKYMRRHAMDSDRHNRLARLVDGCTTSCDGRGSCSPCREYGSLGHSSFRQEEGVCGRFVICGLTVRLQAKVEVVQVSRLICMGF